MLSPWSAQPLAVVAHHHHQRPVQCSASAKPVEQAPQLVVGPGNLAVVRVAGVTRSIGLRRRVGGVRIVEVHPDEIRIARPGRALPFEPCQRGIHDLVGAAFRVELVMARGVAPGSELVVVGVESLGGAVAAVEHEGADERCGRVTLSLQSLGECFVLVRQSVGSVVAHAVPRRVVPGQNRRVCRKRHRHRADHVRKAHASRREIIECRGLGARVAVAADAVAAQGVERHEQDVVPGDGPGRELQRGARGACDLAVPQDPGPSPPPATTPPPPLEAGERRPAAPPGAPGGVSGAGICLSSSSASSRDRTYHLIPAGPAGTAANSAT